jgi:hypothetical protein
MEARGAFLRKNAYGLALIVAIGVLMAVFSSRGGIGFDVETDGSLFARGMLDEVNVTLWNRDNRQQKIVAELVAVRGNSATSADFLGEEARSSATLNSGSQRLITMTLDTAGLDPDFKYKVGLLIYKNENSTDQPVAGSLLAVAHVADIVICDPLDIVNANQSLCNEISLSNLESDSTIP